MCFGRQIRFAPLREIMLSQTMYYGQEFFLITVVSDSEAIL